MELIKNRYLQILAAYFIYSFVGVMAKFAAINSGSFLFFIYLCAEVLLLAMYAFLWQQVLKEFSLTVAMSCKGIVVILSLLWAMLFFDEKVNINHILGSFIVIFGIIIVSGEKEHRDK